MKSSTVLIASFFFATIWLDNLVHAMNHCSTFKMAANYREMRTANCKNCDRYFHCRGNYEAVHDCWGSLKEFTAKKISNGREWIQGTVSGTGETDTMEDQRANEYGRNGGDCVSRYLSAVRCFYDPATKRCGSSEPYKYFRQDGTHYRKIAPYSSEVVN